jgi:hypothetical protein
MGFQILNKQNNILVKLCRKSAKLYSFYSLIPFKDNKDKCMGKVIKDIRSHIQGLIMPQLLTQPRMGIQIKSLVCQILQTKSQTV